MARRLLARHGAGGRAPCPAPRRARRVTTRGVTGPQAPCHQPGVLSFRFNSLLGGPCTAQYLGPEVIGSRPTEPLFCNH